MAKTDPVLTASTKMYEAVVGDLKRSMLFSAAEMRKMRLLMEDMVALGSTWHLSDHSRVTVVDVYQEEHIGKKWFVVVRWDDNTNLVTQSFLAHLGDLHPVHEEV